VSLLYKPLESVTGADLQGLVDNQVAEGPQLEYKEEVFDKRDPKKRAQFLGSIAGFANASGGDLLVGVSAPDGLPRELTGLDPTVVDGEILRITQLVATGVDPQLSLYFHRVPVQSGREVLLIRVPQSWTAPHGIEHDGHFHFFRRNAAGRSPMTLSELRTAFTLAGTIAERTRQFRADRLTTLMAPEGPWGYFEKATAVLHVVPFGSVMETVNIDFSKRGEFHLLSPLPKVNGFVQPGSYRYNLDGLSMRSPLDLSWHTQLFRSGALEYATREFFDETCNPRFLHAWFFQVGIVNVLQRFLTLLRGLGVQPPITIMLTFQNVANLHLRIGEGQLDGRVSDYQIDRSQLILPDAVVTDFNVDLRVVLRPIFDSLWNAAGLDSCLFYKAGGEWPLDPSWLD
jgi:schlafen family protein